MGCELCRLPYCVPSCTLAPDPAVIDRCKCCGDPIIEGEDYYTIGDDYYHEDCFQEGAAAFLLASGAAEKCCGEGVAW